VNWSDHQPHPTRCVIDAGHRDAHRRVLADGPAAVGGGVGERVDAVEVGVAGIVLLTKNLGSAWASDGIRVNAVAPGLIETNMTAPLKDMPEASQQLMDRTPMQRWGTPDDIAGPALFFASSAASFVTGQTLCIGGGFSLA